MKVKKIGIIFLLMILSLSSYSQEPKHDKSGSVSGEMMVRMAAIEVEPNYLNEYIAILKEESEASVRLEPGVICIYPMFQKEDPAQIRLLEIYVNQEAYESHLQTPHFKYYKEKTLKMVKSLKLIEMEAIDAESMPDIFRKLN